MKLDIDATEFNKAIKDWAAATNKGMEAGVRQQMGLLTVRLMEFTPPFSKGSQSGAYRGGTLADRKLGEKAVARDIGKVFVGANRSAVRLFAKGEYKTSDGMPLFMESIDPSFHQRFRDKNTGRVKRKPGGRITVGRGTAANLVHIPKSVLKNYIKGVQAHVGRGKAGWAPGWKKFRKGSPPGWVNRHSAKGRARDAIRFGGGYVEAENNTPQAGRLGGYILQNAIASRIRDIRAALERIAIAAAKKAGR